MSNATISTPLAPKGIGGWLIFPALGTLLSIAINLISSFQTIDPLISEDGVPALRALVLAEFCGSVGFTFAWIYAAVLLFKHKRQFPMTFIILCFLSLIGSIADISIATSVFKMEFTPDDVKSIGRPFLACLIWGPYMVYSKRVRNTFVN